MTCTDDDYEIISAHGGKAGSVAVGAQEPTLQRIEALVRRRSETDRRMSYAWMLVPLLPVAGAVAIGATVAGIIASVVAKVGTNAQTIPPQGVATSILGGILALEGLVLLVYFGVMFVGALSFYYMIDRRNRHFARQQLLFSNLYRYVACKTTKTENVVQIGNLCEDFRCEEHGRPAGLWALAFMFLNPIVGLIVSYDLTQDMRTHDEWQAKYQMALSQSLVDAGFQSPDLPQYNAHKRDPVLFLVLSAITGGLFWIYWFYTLLKDYNDHFTNQASFEDKVLAVLMPAAAEMTCATCGGSVPPRAKFCPNCGRQQTA
jgi:uncharacterized membrane protein